jgi:putative colanic acid biosynthesis glycosyltransferase
MIEVITVTYNNIDGLIETSNSLLEQVGCEFRWIVVDGSSDDGTKDFMTDFIKNNPLLKTLFLSEPDDGIYDAMNKGILLSKGDYIIFLNAGDLLNSFNTLDTLNSNLDNNTNLLVGNSIRFDNVNKVVRKKYKSVSHLKYGMFCEHQAALFNTNIAKKIMYDPRYALSGDYDFFINFTNEISIQSVKFIDVDVCKFLFGGVSYSKRTEAICEDHLIRVKRMKMNFVSSLGISLSQFILHQIKIKLGIIR